MSYRVEYDSGFKWEKKKEEWGFRRVVMAGLFFSLFVILVNFFWADGKDLLFQLLFPGESVTTWNEIQHFSERLHQGIPLKFALQEFCHEILQNCY